MIGWVALLLRCACLHSLLLDSGPWPLFMLGTPTNRERKRERERGRWGLRERQREAEGERERERERRNEAGVALSASLWLAAWLFAWPFACVFVCLPSIRFDAGVLVCSLASLCLQRHGGERESVCEREGNLGLLLAVRLVVRTKAWLAACLGGQVAGWPARCLLIACLPSAVSHLLYASETQKGRERERRR